MDRQIFDAEGALRERKSDRNSAEIGHAQRARPGRACTLRTLDEGVLAKVSALAGRIHRTGRLPAHHARVGSSAGSSEGMLARKARTCIAITASDGVVLSFE
jgi:hypothetical protein